MRSSPVLGLALAGTMAAAAATGCVDNTQVNTPSNLSSGDVSSFHTRFGDLDVQGHLDSYQARILRGIDISCVLKEEPGLEDRASHSVIPRVVGFCWGKTLNPPVVLGAVAVNWQCSGAKGRNIPQGFIIDECEGGFSIGVEIPSAGIHVVFRPKGDFTGRNFLANIPDSDNLETVVMHTFGDGKNQSDQWWKEWQEKNRKSGGKSGNEVIK